MPILQDETRNFKHLIQPTNFWNDIIFFWKNSILQKTTTDHFVGAKIAGQKAANRIVGGAIPTAVHRRVLLKRQVRLLSGRHNVKAEKAVVTKQIAQVDRVHLRATVHVRRVNKAGNLHMHLST